MKTRTRVLCGLVAALAVGFMSVNTWAQDCFELTASELIVDEVATFEVSGAEPESAVLVVWGLNAGETVVTNRFVNLCASFGIRNVKSKTRIVGIAITDENGDGAFVRRVPDFVGAHLLLQAAQFGTCPEECVSSIVERTIQPGR